MCRLCFRFFHWSTRGCSRRVHGKVREDLKPAGQPRGQASQRSERRSLLRPGLDSSSFHLKVVPTATLIASQVQCSALPSLFLPLDFSFHNQLWFLLLLQTTFPHHSFCLRRASTISWLLLSAFFLCLLLQPTLLFADALCVSPI